jgi:hypothetical protein
VSTLFLLEKGTVKIVNSEYISTIVKNAVNGKRVFKSRINKKVISSRIEKELLLEKRGLLDSVEEKINSFLGKKQGSKKNELLKVIAGIIDSFLSSVVDIFDVTMSRRFKDRGLRFLDKQYIIYSTEVLFDKIFCVQDENELQKKIKQIGFLFFDLDGLKPVNEFASQLVGDNFLIAMAFVMSFGRQRIVDFPELENFNSSAEEYCRKNNLEVIVSFFSEGDEYVALVTRTDDKELRTKDVHRLGLLFKEDMKQISTSKMIDFSSERSIKKCDERGIGDLRKKVYDEYGEFDFPFTASFGVSTLELSLNVLIKKMQGSNESACGHGQFIYRLMRIFFQIAEDACKAQKAEYKKKISSQGLRGVFLENLFLRSDSGRRIAFQNDLLCKILFSKAAGDEIKLDEVELEVLSGLTRDRNQNFQTIKQYL